MADLKLVGAVAIKVRPDAKNFRKETQEQIKKELAGVDAKVPVKAELDKGTTKADAEKLEKELDGKEVHWKVKLDRDSVRAAQKKFDSLFEATQAINFKMGDQATIDKAREDLKKMAEDAKVKITYSDDKQGYNEVLKKIEQIRHEKLELPPLEFSVDDAELDRIEEQMREKIRNLPVTFKYNEDEAGLRKVIAQIDAELDNLNAAEVTTKLDRFSLMATKAELEEELRNTTIQIEYENNLASLQAARAKIKALLPDEYKTHIKAELNEASLLKALAEVDAMIAAADQAEGKLDITPKVKPRIDRSDYLKVWTELKALTKNQTVGIFVKLNNAGILLAAAKLTGLRAAARWSEELGKSLGTLDRNLPIVAAVTGTLTGLSRVLVNLTADAFSLGNGLGEVVRMGGVLLPAGMLALASVMTVLKGVFKDFGAAVNGDSKAMEKLTASGQAAAKNMRVIFQDIRETVSKNFWKAAGDDMLEFTKTALPALREGLGTLATSMGGIFGKLVASFSTFAKQNGIDVFFANLNAGFDKAQQGMADFMSGFLTLASVGSTVFPKLGSAFDAWAARFDAWVQRLAADGTLSSWINKGIDGLQALFSAAGNLVKIWSNIGQAAQAAGALTLSSFAAMMAKLEQITAGDRFQRNLANIFKGAREGSEEFKKSLGNIGPVMDTFSVTIKNALANSGAAFGAFARDVADLFSSSNLDKGLTAFLRGLQSMFETLRPAMAPVSEIIRTFGEVLGQVAADSGPLFLSLFTQLASVLSTAWAALQPFLPALIQIGTSIVDILGPAMTSMAGTAIPAFASGLQDLGNGLVPIIDFVSQLAVGFVNWASTLPLPVVAGFTVGIISLGSSFRLVSALAPIATAAVTTFGVEAALAGARVQLLVPVVGIFLAALSGLIAGGVAQFATQQSNATPYANEYAAALREDAKAVNELDKAVGSATLRTAVNNLFDNNLFSDASKIGIDPNTLTDALLKGGPALQEYNKKIAETKQRYNDAMIAAAKGGDGVTSYGKKMGDVTPQILEQNDAANRLTKGFNEQKDSLNQAQEKQRVLKQMAHDAGIELDGEAKSVNLLNEGMALMPGQVSAAAAATRALTDQFASGSAKIDAMRKTFEIFLGKDAKQAAAESLGAYNRGFSDLMETVKPLKGQMQELGDAVYGENGFLNVASGNKAVLQVNQALVEQVNNTWLGAKDAYDRAIQQGKNAQEAFAAARKFIDDHKADFDAMTDASGLARDKVQGQWDSIFNHEYELKISLSGLTEAAAKAKAMITAVHGQFNAEKFMMFIEANPDQALKAARGLSDEVAKTFVNKEFKAQLDLVPDKAKAQLKKTIDVTNDQWNNGDFEAFLEATAKANMPSVTKAVVDIMNGVQGVDIEAAIKADLEHKSVEQARNELDEAAKPRKAPVEVDVKDEEAKKKLQNTTQAMDALGTKNIKPIIDFDVEGGTFKLDNTQNKVNNLVSPKVKPVLDIDVDNVQANTKLDDTQQKVYEYDASRPNPFVDANTGTADLKLKNNLGWLGEISRARPNSVVSATDNASGILRGILNLLNGNWNKDFTVTAHYVTDASQVQSPNDFIRVPGYGSYANGGIAKFFANGGINRPVHRYAGGGLENHVAQIQRAGGPVRIWAEPETKAEAYIPYAQAKRPRSLRILRQVARDFGYDLTKGSHYANGGITAGPSTTTHTSANVHIGTMITSDPDAAVRKLDQARRDALAVAGIH